jgi:hypothetical protein
MVTENFYKKTIHSIDAGKTKAPYAFVMPAGQRDATQVDRVVNLLRRQAIEVRTADAPIKIKDTSYPKGSYVIRLDQPYGRLAKTLLEKQTYPDPNLRTYDDSAWTMGMASNVDIKQIDEKEILDAPATLLTADVVTKGALQGTAGSIIAVKHTRRQAHRFVESDYVSLSPQRH